MMAVETTCGRQEGKTVLPLIMEISGWCAHRLISMVCQEVSGGQSLNNRHLYWGIVIDTGLDKRTLSFSRRSRVQSLVLSVRRSC